MTKPITCFEIAYISYSIVSADQWFGRRKNQMQNLKIKMKMKIENKNNNIFIKRY